MSRLMECASLAYIHPLKLLILTAILGVLLVVFGTYADDPENNIGSYVASVLYLPCFAALTVALIAGIFVGGSCIKSAHDKTMRDMQAQINREYAYEMQAMSDIKIEKEVTDKFLQEYFDGSWFEDISRQLEISPTNNVIYNEGVYTGMQL